MSEGVGELEMGSVKGVEGNGKSFEGGGGIV